MEILSQQKPNSSQNHVAMTSQSHDSLTRYRLHFYTPQNASALQIWIIFNLCAHSIPTKIGFINTNSIKSNRSRVNITKPQCEFTISNQTAAYYHDEKPCTYADVTTYDRFSLLLWRVISLIKSYFYSSTFRIRAGKWGPPILKLSASTTVHHTRS